MKLRIIVLLGLLFLLSCSSLKSSKKLIVEADGTHVMINILHPKEGVSQRMLLHALESGINKDISTIEGYISAAIHASKDSNSVSVYAHWRDKESVKEAINKVQNGHAPFMEKAFSISRTDFHSYKVIKIIR